MKKESVIVIMVSSILLSSCSNSNRDISKDNLVGNWIEVMPVNKHIIQGINLNSDGTASSIGMATLLYDSWEQVDKSKITLTGKSIGNRQTINFTDTLDIVSLKNDTLTLGKGDMYRILYVKKESDNRIPVNSVTNSGGTVCFSFNADSSKVNIFLPEEELVLTQKHKADGRSVWNIEDDDTYLLEKSENEWIISRRGRLLYSTTGREDAIHATFKTNTQDTINVSFYRKSGVAQIETNGIYNLLYQYRTASGYGYKNSVFDLRGKGEEATLTNLIENKSIILKEK